MKFQTHYKKYKTSGQFFVMPSKFVPGQTLSIQEMVRRYATGMEVPGSAKVEWADHDQTEPMPKVRDLTDLDRISSQLKDYKLKQNKKEKIQETKKEETQTPKTDNE